jgi:hypothetical protein
MIRGAQRGAAMSDAFAYLSVLLSIILGLAMAEILQGYGRLLLSRGKIKVYAPPLIWSAMMLLMAAQFWWVSFGLRTLEHWDFAAFCAVLLQTVMLFMGTTLIIPRGDVDDAIDLKAHYYRESVPFFSFGLLFIVIGLFKDWLLDAFERPAWANWFFGFFAGLTFISLVTKHPRVHEIVAPVMAVAIVTFFPVTFWRL